MKKSLILIILSPVLFLIAFFFGPYAIGNQATLFSQMLFWILIIGCPIPWGIDLWMWINEKKEKKRS